MSSYQKAVVPPAFYRALNRFRNSLSDGEKKIFEHLTSVGEVWDLVEELQNEQGPRIALRNMGRIRPFIHGMTQYAGVIEVFVQAKPEIMALIWGPLKMLLQLASKFIESFDRVLDAIERIGENLPRFQRFAKIFSYNDQIQQVISLIYEDIMDFYRRALKFFRRRAWKIVFSLTWDTFGNRFDLILGNLQRHQQLVDNEARAEDIERSHTARQDALKYFEKSKERDRDEKVARVFNWLNPANIEAEKDKIATTRTPGTGNWILEVNEVKEWVEGKGKLIWLTGKPGSGKTVLSFSILEHLWAKKKSTDSTWPVLYFFCGYKQADRNTCLSILRTFIYQIVEQQNDLLPCVYQEWVNDYHSNSSVMKLKTLLCNLLEASVTASEHAYIIIDGLDELPGAERQGLFTVLKALRKTPLNSVARIFVASRSILDIHTALNTPRATEISIEGNNTDDIHRYIGFESQRVADSLGLDVEMKISIANSLRIRADGMFLWVHLVVESLFWQATPKGVRDSLKNLPEGLDQAYERILLRIRSLPLQVQGQANKMLEWLTCGFRTLKVRELEDAFAIHPGDSTVDGGNRPFMDRLRYLCGPIIETTDQDTIVFVHFSVKEYLLSQYSGPFINCLDAHLNISLVCTAYQCFQCFEPALPSDMAARFVLNGDLRLFAYVQSSWLEHIKEFSELSPGQSQLERLSVALRELFRKRNALLPPNLLSPGVNGPYQRRTFSPEIKYFDCFEPDLRKELIRVLEYSEELKQKISVLGSCDELNNWCDGNNPLIVDQSGRILLQVFEDLLNGTSQPTFSANREKLGKLYGKNIYMCRYLFCQMSSGEGFMTFGERESHEKKHARYRCQAQGCIYNDRGFASEKYLRKHMKDYHSASALIKNRSAGADEYLRQALIGDGGEEAEESSILSVVNQGDFVENVGLAFNNEDLVVEYPRDMEVLDGILAADVASPILGGDKSVSLSVDEAHNIMGICIHRFVNPGFVNYLSETEVSKIEILLRQLSGQLKSWKGLVQSFHIVSRNSHATEQLVFNKILHCREQYLDDCETPKGRYTITASALEKTRKRLIQCYLYIQSTTRNDMKEDAELQQPPVEAYQKQEVLVASLQKILEEEKNIHQSRPPLQLQPEEKANLHQHLSDVGTKNIIRRIGQLLPMFVLLGGISKATRELIRMRDLLASQYQENGEPKELFTLSFKELNDCKASMMKYYAFVKQSMSNLYNMDEKKARGIQMRARQFDLFFDASGLSGLRAPAFLSHQQPSAQPQISTQAQLQQKPQAQSQNTQVLRPKLPENVLNASNLQKQTSMLVLEQPRSIQSEGRFEAGYVQNLVSHGLPEQLPVSQPQQTSSDWAQIPAQNMPNQDLALHGELGSPDPQHFRQIMVPQDSSPSVNGDLPMTSMESVFTRPRLDPKRMPSASLDSFGLNRMHQENASSPELMLYEDGPEDDPFHGIEADVFGPQLSGLERMQQENASTLEPMLYVYGPEDDPFYGIEADVFG